MILSGCKTVVSNSLIEYVSTAPAWHCGMSCWLLMWRLWVRAPSKAPAETLPLLFSTGRFQERIQAWFLNRTKINWGPYGRSKDQIKCAKLVEEKNNQMFCCLSVRDFEQLFLSIVYIFTKFEKIMFTRNLIFFLWEKVYILLI